MTAPRTSLIAKIPPLTQRTKKYTHAALLGLATGGLSFLAFNLDSVIVIPKGVKGAILGMLVMGIGKAAGFLLSEIATKDTPDAPQS